MHQADQGTVLGSECTNQTRGLVGRDVEKGSCDRVHGTRDLIDLVAPTGIPNPGINCGFDFLSRLLFALARQCRDLGDELGFSALEHFRDAIQNLATVICTG